MKRLFEPHEPTPQFRSRLEAEVIQRFREETQSTRFLPSRNWQRLRAAAVIALALASGAAGNHLVAQAQDARERNALLAHEQSELALAEARLNLARTAANQATRNADLGITSRDAAVSAEAQWGTMEARVNHIRLNIEEIQATRRAPRNDLGAPLVGNQDFVTARLELEAVAAQQRLVAAERLVDEVRRRNSVGLAPRVVLLEAEVDAAKAKTELEYLVGKLQLRQQFLHNGITLAELSKQEQRIDLERQLEVAVRVQELAEERLARINQLRQVRQVEQVDVLRVELEVAEQAADIERIKDSIVALGR